MNRCVLRVGPGGLESLGLLPTLPPHVFLERSHFFITNRFEAGFEWLGPRPKSDLPSLWIQKGPLEEQALVPAALGGWAH